MSRITLALVAVALVFGSVSLVAQADSPQSNWNQICKDFDNFGFDNHGQCVSWVAQQVNNSGPAAFCKSTIFGVEWWEILGFKNRGACVSFIRGL